jgi:hypothetical protein
MGGSINTLPNYLEFIGLDMWIHNGYLKAMILINNTKHGLNHFDVDAIYYDNKVMRIKLIPK